MKKKKQHTQRKRKRIFHTFSQSTNRCARQQELKNRREANRIKKNYTKITKYVKYKLKEMSDLFRRLACIQSTRAQNENEQTDRPTQSRQCECEQQKICTIQYMQNEAKHQVRHITN